MVKLSLALFVIAVAGMIATGAALFSGFSEDLREDSRSENNGEVPLDGDTGEEEIVDDGYTGDYQPLEEDRGGELSKGENDSGEDQNLSEEGGDNRIPPLFTYTASLTALFLLSALILSGKAVIDTRGHQNMVRNDLLDLITVNPGINLTSIRRELDLSQGAVSYHLRRLEKSGEILTNKGRKERRFYPSSMGFSSAMDHASMDEMESVMSSDSSRRIVKLLSGGEKSQSEIVESSGLSPSTVHWHMERLRKAGMVSKRRSGRSVKYSLSDRFDNT